jgi:hypothetical protein
MQTNKAAQVTLDQIFPQRGKKYIDIPWERSNSLTVFWLFSFRKLKYRRAEQFGM